MALKRIPPGTKLDMSEIHASVDRALELSRAFAGRIESLTQHVTEARDRLKAEARESIRGVDSSKRGMAREVAANMAGKKLRVFHANLIKSSESDRMRILAPLRELRERAAFLREITPNAAAILTRIGAGTERRARLIAELENEGNAVLENMAYTALTTDDKILASAVASVVGRRKREDRPFTIHEIADAAVGDLYAQLSAKLLEVENAANEAEGRHREFITGERNAVLGLETALRQREIDRLSGDDTEDADAA